MFRIFLFFVFIALLAAGFSWIADQKGSLTLVFGGQTMELSILQAVIGLLMVVSAMILTWTIIKGIVTAPGNIAAGVRNRRENKSLEALNKGLIAASSGDIKLANKLAKKASRTLKHQPMSAVLRAKAAQMSGDNAGARRIFEAMLESPDTEIMGLRGLYEEARRVDELMAARQFAERAAHLNPNLGWAIEGLLEIQSRAGEWYNARQTLKLASLNKLVPANTAKRHRAVLLAAEAMELEVDDAQDALKLALEAHGLAKDLVPAAEVAGRILASQGKAARAASIVAKTWELSPHPDLALIYAHARPGDSIRDRMKRITQLAAKRPENIEGAIAIANTALEGNLWKEARAALEPLLEDNPPARVCTLMAQIEAGEYGDKGRVREWLARAVRAPRDPAWIAEGFISEHWLPVSPVSGKLDAFTWDVPRESTSIHESNMALENLVNAPSEPEMVSDDTSAGGLSDLRSDAEPPEGKKEATPRSLDKSSKPSDGSSTRPVTEDAEIIPDNAVKTTPAPVKASKEAQENQNTAGTAPSKDDKSSAAPKDTHKNETGSTAKSVVNGTAKPSVKLKTGSASAAAPHDKVTFSTTKPEDGAKQDEKAASGDNKDARLAHKKESVIFVAPRAPDDPGPTTGEGDTSPENKNLAERYRSRN